MRKYLFQIVFVCGLVAVVGCSRKWNNPVESAVPLPGVPGLISPANNVWIWNTQNTITFAWSKVDGATKYKLLLSNYSTISDSFIAIEIADTFYNWVDTNKLGKMYWQVKAWNPINEWKSSLINIFEKGPYVIGKIPLPGQSTGRIKKINDLLYFSRYTTGLKAYDIGDINNTVEVGSYAISGSGDFDINTNYVFAACGSGGVKVLYNNNLSYVSEWVLPTDYASELFIKNDLCYVAYGYNGLRVLNISNITNIIEIGLFSKPNLMVLQVMVVDTLAYLATSKGLKIVNVKNNSNIFEVATYDSSTMCSSFIMNYPYVIDRYKVLNISNPLFINLLNTMPCLASEFEDWHYYNDYIYYFYSNDYTNSTTGFKVYKYTDPSLINNELISTTIIANNHTTDRLIKCACVADGLIFLSITNTSHNDSLIVLKTLVN